MSRRRLPVNPQKNSRPLAKCNKDNQLVTLDPSLIVIGHIGHPLALYYIAPTLLSTAYTTPPYKQTRDAPNIPWPGYSLFVNFRYWLFSKNFLANTFERIYLVQINLQN